MKMTLRRTMEIKSSHLEVVFSGNITSKLGRFHRNIYFRRFSGHLREGSSKQAISFQQQEQQSGDVP